MAVLLSAGFWAPFTFHVCGDDHKPDQVNGRVRFKRLRKSERKALDKRLEARSEVLRIDSGIPSSKTPDEIAKLRETAISEAEFCREMVVDWELNSVDGQTILWTPAEMEDAFEENDGLDIVLFGAYFTAMNECHKAGTIAKNSAAPSDTTGT